jgi:uncharacterized membrane protein YphA (DoxX/SURF4 family)
MPAHISIYFYDLTHRFLQWYRRGMDGIADRGCGSWAYTAVRCALAAVFLWAGIVKLADPRAFATLVAAYGLVPAPLLMPVAVGLPAAEVVAAIGLLADIRGALAIISVLLTAFIAVLIYGIRMGLDVDCGCFGPADVESRAFHGLQAALVRDVGMAAGAACLYAWRRFHSVRPVSLMRALHGVTTARPRPRRTSTTRDKGGEFGCAID